MKTIFTKITNCKKAAIRKTPWRTLFEKDIVGQKRHGEIVEIDPTKTCYDWHDRKFYKVINPRGWIHDGVIDYKGDDV